MAGDLDRREWCVPVRITTGDLDLERERDPRAVRRITGDPERDRLDRCVPDMITGDLERDRRDRCVPAKITGERDRDLLDRCVSA